MNKVNYFSRILGLVCLGLAGSASALAAQAPVAITLLHTNDLHSHFRGEKTPLGLGGVARLKTAISRIRASTAHSVLVDGGDWSEGNIYYTEGAGLETLKMMDFMGYDVAVVGNHDWLNGADTLLNIVEQANLNMKVVAANITTSNYARGSEFVQRIPPYVIQDVGGVKIAFIGLLTYEFIYDKYFSPIKIAEPFSTTRELAAQLKKQADAVIVISHNSIKTNQQILKAAPDVDLLIGAHDHVKLTQPVVVQRAGAKPAWIVETGCWGRYLGRVDLQVTPRDPTQADSKGSVDLLNYRLQQMDASVPEDPETLARVEQLETTIQRSRGSIFTDHVGDSDVELSRGGQENLMGDFATDAYAAATGADLALDQTQFIYNEIHEGAVSTVDVFNSNPGVYNPKTGKSWTLNLLPMQGKTLSWVLNLLYSTKSLSQSGAINFSGADIVYNSPISALSTASAANAHASLSSELDPTDLLKLFGFGSALSSTPAQTPDGISIKSFKIRGQDIQSDRTYMVAASGGIVQALQFLDGLIPGAVPIDQMRDTGQEDWRVMADYLAAHSPLQSQSVLYGRVHTTPADLGILYDDVSWVPQGRDSSGRMLARVSVRVRNTGASASAAGTASSGPSVALLINQNGVDYSVDPIYSNAAPAQPLPAIEPGSSTLLTWESVAIPEALGLYALMARITGNGADINPTNDQVTRFFVAEPAAPRRLASGR